MFNIFFLAFGAIAAGLIIAVLITRHAPNPLGMVQPEDAYSVDPKPDTRPSIEKLFAVAEKLCGENQLRIKEKMKNSEHEWYWITESLSDFIAGTYILAFYECNNDNPVVRLTDILEFKDFIKSVQGGRGMAFTNGFFTRDVLQPLEGPKVTLYNKTRALAEMGRLGMEA